MGMNQTEDTKFKNKGSGAKLPETLENFYEPANDNYCKFINFPIFHHFSLISTFANTSKKIRMGGVGVRGSSPKPLAYAPVANNLSNSCSKSLPNFLIR